MWSTVAGPLRRRRKLLLRFAVGSGSPSQRDGVLAVRVKRAGGGKVPPVFSRLEWSGSQARLLPQVSITRGVTYQAVFAADRVSPGKAPLIAEYMLPLDRSASDAQVTQVYPVQPVLPANLLKFYVQFSRPMAEGKVFQHVRLLEAWLGASLFERHNRRVTLTPAAKAYLEEIGPLFERLSQATARYGVFATVLGLLAWVYLATEITVYSAEVNVVLERRLWPRSIVQPPLTEADRVSMALQALQNQRRPEQDVTVTFNDRQPDDEAPATTPQTPAEVTPPGDPRVPEPRGAADPSSASDRAQ